MANAPCSPPDPASTDFDFGGGARSERSRVRVRARAASGVLHNFGVKSSDAMPQRFGLVNQNTSVLRIVVWRAPNWLAIVIETYRSQYLTITPIAFLCRLGIVAFMRISWIRLPNCTSKMRCPN
jgi:hypothetical protein